LPQTARGMNDTADLVQDTIISAMRHLKAFESRHQGALQAYLRQAVMNRIRDIIRHQKRRPEVSGLSEGIQDEATSPLEATIGAENLERYERALQRLKPDDREAIIGRLEMLYPYEELATVLGRPSAAAARMAVTRAMKRLAEEMQHV
jgi:RNA polymerase sigma-70 factor (ECF subfamily)